MSPPTTAADKSQQLPLPSSRDVGTKIGGVGVRRSEGDKKWSEEAGEWGRRRQGKRRGKEEAMPPFFILYFEPGQHLLPHFFAFRTGAAFAAPMSFHFVSNGGSACCPRVFSFLFKWRQHLLPPCLFFSFRTGAALAAPVSFLFVLNGRGGSVWDSCCPHFSQFRSGAALSRRITNSTINVKL